VKPAFPLIEPLEARIAPAMATLQIVDAHTATYTDSDGDLVSVKVSKGTLDSGGANFIGIASGSGDQLQQLDLTDIMFAGANVTITAAPPAAGPGDGFVHIGYLNATGFDLGAVNIHGDLGAIDAGDSTAKTPALKSLTLQSFGTFGTTTGAPNLNSDIVGGIRTLTIKGTMSDAVLDVTGGTDGKIGAVTIGGSLLADASILTANRGSIHSTGDIGKVKIGLHLEGGGGTGSGSIRSDGKIGPVTIGGHIFGGGGVNSGVVRSGGDMGNVSVVGDIIGISTGPNGGIVSGGKLGNVFVGGSMQGSLIIANLPNNAVIMSAKDMGNVTILGDMSGAGTPNSATITSGGKIASVTVNGSITAGIAANTAKITAATSIGKVVIGGDLSGGSASSLGSANGSGSIVADTIGSITIAGSFSGGSNSSSAALTEAGIISATSVKQLTILGDLLGGSVTSSGSINASGAILVDKLGKLVVKGVLAGGNNSGTGTNTDTGVVKADTIDSILIGSGGLRGGSAQNGDILRSGVISATTKIKTLTINGDLDGGGVSGDAIVDSTGTIVAGHIDKLLITGSINAGFRSQMSTGTVANTGSINLAHDISSLTVRGSLNGTADSGAGAVPVVISARGQATPKGAKDLAIGSLSIGGDVFLAKILAGYDPALVPLNGDAQIGKVSVVGDWSESSLVAGVKNAASTNVFFGDGNDASIGAGNAGTTASIASITIGGVISGRAGTGDHFGFAAQKIAKFTLGGLKIPLGASPFTRDIGTAGDVSIHLL